MYVRMYESQFTYMSIKCINPNGQQSSNSHLANVFVDIFCIKISVHLVIKTWAGFS
jgi:hypothetical protein